MGGLRAGARLAVSMFTVVPVRAAAGDTDSGTDVGAARTALVLVPALGAVLGALLGGVAAGLTGLGAPALLAGLVAVGLGAAATRGLHLDGLADLADGLGTHGSAERALAAMRDPGIGAFAVMWLVVVLGVQAAALGALGSRGWVDAVAGGALALGLGRASFAWGARRGVPATPGSALGSLVAGTQAPWVAPVWALVLAAGGAAVLGWLRVVVAVVLAAVVVVVVTAHARRRLGGVSGDVFGAVCELTVTVALAALTLLR